MPARGDEEEGLLRSYYRDITASAPLSRAREAELAVRIKAGDVPGKVHKLVEFSLGVRAEHAVNVCVNPENPICVPVELTFCFRLPWRFERNWPPTIPFGRIDLQWWAFQRNSACLQHISTRLRKAQETDARLVFGETVAYRPAVPLVTQDYRPAPFRCPISTANEAGDDGRVATFLSRFPKAPQFAVAQCQLRISPQTYVSFVYLSGEQAFAQVCHDSRILVIGRVGQHRNVSSVVTGNGSECRVIDNTQFIDYVLNDQAREVGGLIFSDQSRTKPALAPATEALYTPPLSITTLVEADVIRRCFVEIPSAQKTVTHCCQLGAKTIHTIGGAITVNPPISFAPTGDMNPKRLTDQGRPGDIKPFSDENRVRGKAQLVGGKNGRNRSDGR